MKKLIILVFVMFICLINIFINEKTMLISGSIHKLLEDSNSFQRFFLLFDEKKLTIRSLEKELSFFNSYTYERIAIYPFLVTNTKKYFISKPILFGINEFYKKYLQDTKLDQTENFNPFISIRLLQIYTSNEAIYNYLLLNKVVKYSLKEEGSFIKLYE